MDLNDIIDLNDMNDMNDMNGKWSLSSKTQPLAPDVAPTPPFCDKWARRQQIIQIYARLREKDLVPWQF
jgi:hypothetical protein